MLKNTPAAWTCVALLTLSGVVLPAQGTEQTTKPFEPKVGQAGKDVVWVPTPQALVEKMLDMARVTAKDYLVDLGAGDGRTVITAAKRGLRAHGIEYNPDMVELAKRNAAAAGVSDRATFERADIFKSDFSKAQVVTMFLLQTLNMRLRPTLLDMPPGTRIVSNTFSMEDWEPDQRETVKECPTYCTAMLWIVPAKVQGTWRVDGPDQKGVRVQQPFKIVQTFQTFSGTLGSTTIATGRLNGADITCRVGAVTYTGRVNGRSMSGKTSTGGAWTATRS